MHKIASNVEMGCRVLMAASMKTFVFWDVAACSLVEVYGRFRNVCCLHLHPDGGSGKHL